MRRFSLCEDPTIGALSSLEGRAREQHTKGHLLQGAPMTPTIPYTVNSGVSRALGMVNPYIMFQPCQM